jgi:hypothetical protein
VLLGLAPGAAALAAECLAAKAAGAYPPGVQLRYAVAYRSEARYDFGALLASPQGREGAVGPLGGAVDATLHGTMVLASLDAATPHRQVAARFVEPRVEVAVSGVPDPGLVAQVQSDLSRDFYLAVAADGRVAGVSVRPGAHVVAQGLVRALLGMVQVGLPAQGQPKRQWTVFEDDPAGRFSVAYAVRPRAQADPPDTVRLRKTRRASAAPAPEFADTSHRAIPRETVATGELSVTYDAARSLVIGIEGTERQIVSMAQRRVGDSSVRLRVELAGVDCLDAAARARKLALAQADAAWHAPRASLASDMESPRERSASISRSTLGEDTLATLLEALDRLGSGSSGAPSETALYLKLKALLSLDPAAADPLGQRAASLEATGRAWRLVIDALAGAGHPQAQAALRAALARSQTEVSTQVLVLTLATLAEPAAESVEAVAVIAASVGRPRLAATAQLGLAVMARRLRTSDPRRSESLVAGFVGRLEASDADLGRRHWLMVLGNAGARSSLIAIARHLSDPEASTRATAVGALRWIDDARVQPLLLRALARDPDESVRVAAARTIAFRPPEPEGARALRSAFRSDPRDQARVALAEVLWELRVHDPRAEAIVRQAARDDPSEPVRRACAKLVEGSS